MLLAAAPPIAVARRVALRPAAEPAGRGRVEVAEGDEGVVPDRSGGGAQQVRAGMVEVLEVVESDEHLRSSNDEVVRIANEMYFTASAMVLGDKCL